MLGFRFCYVYARTKEAKMKNVDENKVMAKLSEAVILRDKILSDFEKLESIKAELATISCPHDIGDIIQIKGYSFAGKSGIVERISPYSTGISRSATELDAKWTIHGSVLKKDGSKSKNSFTYNEGGKW